MTEPQLPRNALDGAADSSVVHRRLPPNAAIDAANSETTRDRMRASWQRAVEFVGSADEVIQRMSGRNLMLAIAIGLSGGAIFVLSLVFVKVVFVVFVAAIVGFAVPELAIALRRRALRVPVLPSTVAGIALVVLPYFRGEGAQWLTLLAGAVLVMLWRLLEQLVPRMRTAPGALVRDLAASVFVLVYVPFLASFATMLTSYDGGEWWILAGLIVVVAVDVSAYAVGRSLGHHHLAPRISPNKTWEGTAGAALGALLAGVLLAVFMLQQPWWVGLLLGSVVVVVATLGDLGESEIKRELGVKDMSNWLPGHGGFLDRLDSMLPSCAVAFAAYLVFAPGAPL